jgi:hypothetical protein
LGTGRSLLLLLLLARSGGSFELTIPRDKLQLQKGSYNIVDGREPRTCAYLTNKLSGRNTSLRL